VYVWKGLMTHYRLRKTESDIVVYYSNWCGRQNQTFTTSFQPLLFKLKREICQVYYRHLNTSCF